MHTVLKGFKPLSIPVCALGYPGHKPVSFCRTQVSLGYIPWSGRVCRVRVRVGYIPGTCSLHAYPIDTNQTLEDVRTPPPVRQPLLICDPIHARCCASGIFVVPLSSFCPAVCFVVVVPLSASYLINNFTKRSFKMVERGIGGRIAECRQTPLFSLSSHIGLLVPRRTYQPGRIS